MWAWDIYLENIYGHIQKHHGMLWISHLMAYHECFSLPLNCPWECTSGRSPTKWGPVNNESFTILLVLPVPNNKPLLRPAFPFHIFILVTSEPAREWRYPYCVRVIMGMFWCKYWTHSGNSLSIKTMAHYYSISCHTMTRFISRFIYGGISGIVFL